MNRSPVWGPYSALMMGTSIWTRAKSKSIRRFRIDRMVCLLSIPRAVRSLYHHAEAYSLGDQRLTSGATASSADLNAVHLRTYYLMIGRSQLIPHETAMMVAPPVFSTSS